MISTLSSKRLQLNTISCLIRIKWRYRLKKWSRNSLEGRILFWRRLTFFKNSKITRKNKRRKLRWKVQSQAPQILALIPAAKALLAQDKVKAIELLIIYRTPIQAHCNMDQMLYTTPSCREERTIGWRVLEQLEGNLLQVDVFFLVIPRTEIINTATSIQLNQIRFRVYLLLHIAQFLLEKSWGNKLTCKIESVNLKF